MVVPAERGDNMPGMPVALMVPVAVLLLLHVPPVFMLERDKGVPTQPLVAPVIGASAFTDMVAVVLQVPMA